MVSIYIVGMDFQWYTSTINFNAQRKDFAELFLRYYIVFSPEILVFSHKFISVRIIADMLAESDKNSSHDASLHALSPETEISKLHYTNTNRKNSYYSA